MKVLIPFIMMVAALTVACSDRPPKPDNCGKGDAPASCWYEKGCWDLQCSDFNDNGVCFTATGEENMKTACEKQNKGVFHFGCPCPRENAIGGCRNGQLSERVITTWVYGKGMTEKEFRDVCETSVYNTFVPPKVAEM